MWKTRVTGFEGVDGGIDGGLVLLQAGMTKTDAASQTLAEINPDVILEVGIVPIIMCYVLLKFE